MAIGGLTVSVRILDMDEARAMAGALNIALEALGHIRDLPSDSHYGAAEEIAAEAVEEISDTMGRGNG